MVRAALQQEGPDGALHPLTLFFRKLSGSQVNLTPGEKECYAIVATLPKWHGLLGNKRVEVRTDHRSLENLTTEDLRTVGGPPARQAQWHELLSTFDLHVFRAVVAPVVTRSRSNAAPGATGAPACDPAPRALAPGGGGAKRTKELRKLEHIAKISKSWMCHKKGTPIHGEDAPNGF